MSKEYTLPLINKPYFDIPVVEEYRVEQSGGAWVVKATSIKRHRTFVEDMPSVESYPDILLTAMLTHLKDQMEAERKAAEGIEEVDDTDAY